VLGSLEGTGGAFVDRAGGGAVSAVSEGGREEGEITIFFVLAGGLVLKIKARPFQGKRMQKGRLRLILSGERSELRARNLRGALFIDIYFMILGNRRRL